LHTIKLKSLLCPFFFPSSPKWDWIEITPMILLGRLPHHVSNIKQLQLHGVKAIVAVTEEWELQVHPKHFLDNGISFLLLPTPDYFSPTIQQIEQGIEFINNAENLGHKVYIHCHAGRGRSAILVIAYLVVKNGWTLAEAFSYVRKRRAIANLPILWGMRPQWRVLQHWASYYKKT